MQSLRQMTVQSVAGERYPDTMNNEPLGARAARLRNGGRFTACEEIWFNPYDQTSLLSFYSIKSMYCIVAETPVLYSCCGMHLLYQDYIYFVLCKTFFRCCL